MEVSVPGCVGFVDAASFNGYNLGCFANQRGLQQGLAKLALDLNLGACNFKDTENAAHAVCQLKFSSGNRLNTKQHVCLKTSRRLQCHRGQAQELFVNYSIENYWIKLLSDCDTQPDTDLIKLLRWICAENMRKNYPLDLQHSYSVSSQDTFEITCPFQLQQSSKRHRN